MVTNISNVGVNSVAAIALSMQNKEVTRLEAASFNLANVDNAGFKAMMVMPQAVTYSKSGYPDISYVRATHLARDLAPGAFKPTGDPLHLYIAGNGYFKIQTPGGSRYTRDGRFTRSKEGLLVDAHGNTVEGGISIPGNIALVEIKKNGEIFADGNLIGQVSVYEFENEATSLTNVGFGLYRAEIEGQKTADSHIRPGGYEESNVEAVREMVKLNEIMRNYEFAQKLAAMEDTQQRKAINISTTGKA